MPIVSNIQNSQGVEGAQTFKGGPPSSFKRGSTVREVHCTCISSIRAVILVLESMLIIGS